MARKTKQQAEETRQEILDAAIKTFSERGVSATSLADIAKAAGLPEVQYIGISKTKLISFIKLVNLVITK